MGYYSEWKIAAKGEPARVQQLLGFIEKRLGETREAYDNGSMFERLWDGDRKFNADKSYLILGGTSKCYGSWDDVVYEVLEFGRDELGLDISYGRLGEDLGDSDFSTGEDVHVSWTWDLTDPDDFEDGGDSPGCDKTERS